MSSLSRRMRLESTKPQKSRQEKRLIVVSGSPSQSSPLRLPTATANFSSLNNDDRFPTIDNNNSSGSSSSGWIHRTATPPTMISIPIPTTSTPASFYREADKNVKDRNFAARISATPNVGNFNAGPFVDRGQSVYPSSLCVRCSAHASICMPCCDLQSQSAVSFYRKSMAKGSSAILSEAIKEAGLTRTVKAFIFQLWKNSSQKTSRDLENMYVRVGVAADKKRMIPIFRSWRRITQQSKVARKNGTITELEGKIRMMEKSHQLMTEEKNAAVKEMMQARDSLRFTVNVNEGNISQITDLKEKLQKEKSKVLTMSALCGPLLDLTQFISGQVTKQCKSYESVLAGIHATLPAHDYSDIYSERDAILRSVNVRRGTADGMVVEPNNRSGRVRSSTIVVPTDEAAAAGAESLKLMVQWLNHMSLSVKMISQVTSTGETYDSCLPRHEQIFDLSHLKSGRVLSRVVCALVYYGIEMDRSSPTLAAAAAAGNDLLSNETKLEVARMALTTPPEKGGKRRLLTDQELAALKEQEDNPEALLRLTLQYAHHYLHVPKFEAIYEFSMGDPPTILLVVGCLIFISPPTLTPDRIEDSILLIQEQKEALDEAGQCLGHLESASLLLNQISTAWDTYYDDAEQVPAAMRTERIPSVASAQRAMSTRPHRASSAGGATGIFRRRSTAVSALSLSSAPNPAFAASLSADVDKSQESLEERYAKLSALIDRFQTSEEGALLVEAISEVADNALRVEQLRDTVEKTRKSREQGMRLATDVRMFMLSYWLKTVRDFR